MARLGKIVVLILMFTNIAASIRLYRQEKVDVTKDYQSCILPCAVQSNNNKTLVNRPFLIWERYYNFNFTRLSDTEFWLRKKGLHFHSIPNFCTERPNSDGVYDCDLIISPCSQDYGGVYRCNVYQFGPGEGSEVSRNVRLELGGLKDSYEDCETPGVTLNASLIDTGNGTHDIKFSWIFADVGENVTVCRQELSVRWFTSTVPYDFDDKSEPRAASHRNSRYTPLSDSRASNYLFRNARVRNYHQFELRIYASPGTTSARTYHHYSYLYYFSQQVQAQVIEPSLSHTVIRAREGDSVTIPCAGQGLPRPTVRLLRDINDDQPRACPGCPVTDIGNIFNAVSKFDAGEYFCVAGNTLVNPPEGKRVLRDWKSIELIVEQVVPIPKNQSYCDQYSHSTCGAFIDQSMMVYIDGASVNGDVELLQQQALKLIKKIQRHANTSSSSLNPNLRDKCSLLAQSIACHATFPYCLSDSEDTPIPRPICRTTCDSFSSGGLCWEFLNEQTSPELYQRITAGCDTRQLPGGTSPECIPISPDSARTGHYAEIEHSWCSIGNGRSYIGSVQRTRSGRQCQAWSSQVPHKHPFHPLSYPTELLTNRFACRNPGGVGEGPWCYTADPQVRWEYCDVPQCEICEQYDGSFCSALPGYSDGNMTIFINRSLTTSSQDSIELYLQETLDELNRMLENESWSHGCEFAVKQLLCHSTLPFCKSQDKAAPLKPCRDQCKLLDTVHFCSRKAYLHLLTVMRRESHIFFLSPEDCRSATADDDDSNSLTSTSSASSDCMPPPKGLPLSANRDSTCYNPEDKGQSYLSTMSTTRTGMTCQSWNSRHQLIHADLFPELRGADNFCRNPGQLKETIWCFVSPTVWDYCFVMSNCSADPIPSSSSDPVLNTILATIFTFIATVLIIVCIFAPVCCYLKARKVTLRRNHSPPPILHSMKKVPSEMKMVENGNYVTDLPLTPKMIQTISKFHQLNNQMTKSSIRYIKQIGQGNFGVVFMGKMLDVFGILSEESIVAVKTLKDDCQEALEDFAREARIMLQLDHPNIIKLYGVCTESMPYYLVFEYMDQGDLTKFLRENASSQQRRYMNPSSGRHSRTESTLSDDPPSLSRNQLADISKQIASGMEYLAAKDHVHRDLACRNCLVKSCPKAEETCSKVIVKIGDFGMSHDLYQRNYYRVQGQAVLPVRWMSPEAVVYGKFTTAGDVWSFGVTMWEIFSFAIQPYYGISNEEVTKFIRSGKHLEKPRDCPDQIYAIMQQCWNLEPEERPSFTILQEMINEFRFSFSSESSSPDSLGSSPTRENFEEVEDNVFEDSPPDENVLHEQILLSRRSSNDREFLRVVSRPLPVPSPTMHGTAPHGDNCSPSDSTPSSNFSSSSNEESHL